MNLSNLRIFVTTSHISTVYMTLLAKATSAPETTDILLIDTGTRRKELLTLIHATAAFHPWKLVHDFSTVVEEMHDFKPTLRKTATRKIKTWPLLKQIYNGLLKRYLKKRDAGYQNELLNLLQPFLNANSSPALFLMTQ